jgi:hypothetical protein
MHLIEQTRNFGQTRRGQINRLAHAHARRSKTEKSPYAVPRAQKEATHTMNSIPDDGATTTHFDQAKDFATSSVMDNQAARQHNTMPKLQEIERMSSNNNDVVNNQEPIGKNLSLEIYKTCLQISNQPEAQFRSLLRRSQRDQIRYVHPIHHNIWSIVVQFNSYEVASQVLFDVNHARESFKQPNWTVQWFCKQRRGTSGYSHLVASTLSCPKVNSDESI